MIAIKGKFNGSVVILEEPAPVSHEIAVIVEFPEMEETPTLPPRHFHWDQTKQDDYAGNVTDELLRQRRSEETDAA